MLNPGEVHVWCARPEELGGDAEGRRLLAPEELERAARYRFECHRRIAVATRVLLRTVLSRYEAVPPGDWRFVVDEHGRPTIAEGGGSLRFSLSNTDGLVACAVARGVDLGVDVERLRRRAPLEVADRFFAPAEVAALRALPERARHRRFFDYWTLKESYIKARGLGLALPLEKFSISFHEGSPRIEIDPSLGDDGASWQLAQQKPTREHVLSLCVRKPGKLDARVVLLRIERQSHGRHDRSLLPADAAPQRT
jgi:4'-phosphopantetheinyl transferase